MDSELNVKEVAFNKIIQWLKEHGFSIDKEVRKKDRNSEIQFEAKAYLPNQNRMSFFVTFSNKFKDCFTIRGAVGLPEQYAKTIDKGMKMEEQQQIYIDIYRLVFSVGINCDTSFPVVKLHKLLFIDSLNKQLFFDSMFNLIHAMMLVEGRFDELINSYLPGGE